MGTNTSDIVTILSDISLLTASSHSALTLGSSNGLTLSGQELSLSLASSSSIGALSSADWNTFNNKLDLTSLSALGGISYNNTTGQFTDALTFNG